MSFYGLTDAGMANVISFISAAFTGITLVVTMWNYRKTTMLTTLSTMSALIKDYSQKINSEMKNFITVTRSCNINLYEYLKYTREFLKITDMLEKADKNNTYRDIMETYLSDKVLEDLKGLGTLTRLVDDATVNVKLKGKNDSEAYQNYKKKYYPMLKQLSENYKKLYEFMYGSISSQEDFEENMIMIENPYYYRNKLHK